MNNYTSLLPVLAAVSGAFLAAQTCPLLNIGSTPRIQASEKQVVVAMRQQDGSFSGFFGPRIAPLLLGTETPNLQNMITSCYPITNKKGAAAFSSLARPGWSSYLGDYADLDGDGVLDGVLIAYHPNVVFVVLMAPSNVPKAGYPQPVTLPGPPVAVRAVDVNGDGKPDLVISAGPALTGNPPAQMYVLLNNGNGTFSGSGPQTQFPAGANPGSFAVIDVNGDGYPDLVVADQGSADGTGGGVAILFGNGKGSFSAPSFLPTQNTAATSVVVGDFNGDGKLDIAAATGSTVSLFTGAGGGAFNARTTFPSGGDSTYLAMGDFNGDGKLDLVSSNYQEQTAAVLLNNGSASGGFLAPVSYVISRGRSTDFLVVTDFNNDGIPDILGGVGSASIIAGNSTNAIDVLMGNGDGTFTAPPIVPVGSTPLAFAVAGDFNGDGKMDVAAMSQRTSTIYFYAGRGDGTFAAPVSTALGTNFQNAIGGIAADFNGDGVADLAILTNTGFSIALGQKSGSFQGLSTNYETALSLQSLAIGDFNGDGKLDIAVPICPTNGGPSVLHVYNGNGAGVFTDTQPLRFNYCPSALIGLDVNGDKKPDLLSLNNSGASSGAYSSVDVFLNQGQGVFATSKGYPLDPNGIVNMTVVDVNGDGSPDIVATSSYSKPLQITTILNNGDGTFGSRTFTPLDTPPLAIAAADLNGDKKGDLIITPNQGGPTSATNDLSFAVGNGDGTFQAPVHFAGPNTPALQFADFNGDGRPDLLAGSTSNAPVGYFVVMLTGAPPSAPPPTVSTVNGARFTAGAPVAADSIASVFGTHLAVASNLAGTTVNVKDSAGATQNATLFFVSPGQVNFQVPAGTANGMATVTVTAADGTATSGTFQVTGVAPGLFATNSTGLYAGSILRVHADGSQTMEQNYQLDASQNVIPLPVNLGSDQIFLILYGTGIKHAKSVTATVANQTTVPVAYFGAQGAFIGEDQVNLGPLPLSLAGTGKANIVLTADGTAANIVNFVIQ